VGHTFHTCLNCDHLIINDNPILTLCPDCGEPMYRECDEYPDIEEEEE
jgi:predicted  nucleic acid-binding Zn-ribbon protein